MIADQYNIADLLLSRKINPTQVLQTNRGGLNQNVFLSSSQGDIVVRTPLSLEERAITVAHMHDEYEAIGLSAGEWTLRSPEEQFEDASKMWDMGIKVTLPIMLVEQHLVYPLYNHPTYAQVLDKVSLPQALKITNEFLRTLMDANKQGVVIGDRWGPNEFVIGKNIVFHDLDTKLTSVYAKEFELAQAIYYTLLYAKSHGNIIGLHICELLINEQVHRFYDWQRIKTYLEGHANYFYGTEFGGIELSLMYCFDHIEKSTLGAYE